MLEAYLIFFFTCLLIYHYIINNFTPLYWKRKGFPTINGEIPLGDLLLGKKSAIDSDIDYYKKVGKHKAAGLMEFGNPTLFIKDLDLVRDIFIKDFDYFVDHRHFANSDPMLSDSLFFLSGQSWKDMRSFLSPTFTSGKIRKMFKHFERSCQNLRKYIKICSFPNSKTLGYNVKVSDAIRRFTCEVIGSSVFGVDVDVFTNRDSEFNKMAGKLGEFGFKRKIQMGIAVNLPKLAKFLQIRLMDPEASEFFISVMEHTMNFREEERPIDDFLHLLLEAKKKGGLNQEEVAEDEIHYTEEQVTSKSNIKWTDKLAMNQAMIFLLAGFDTVANNLSIFLYEMARHVEIQEKVYKEVITVLDNGGIGGKIGYETCNKFPYLDMVVAEVLRLYPAISRLERQCIKDYKIPDTNLIIPKGTMIAISAEAIHRDENNYPDPLKFDPERFNDVNKAKRNNYAYMPFGIGQRNCIGMRFALTETKAAIAHVLKEFEITLMEGDSVDDLKIKREVFGYRIDPDAKLHFIPRQQC